MPRLKTASEWKPLFNDKNYDTFNDMIIIKYTKYSISNIVTKIKIMAWIIVTPTLEQNQWYL